MANSTPRGTQPEIQNVYDTVPYPNLSYSPSHPNRLATAATLLGMDPPPVDRCRVLELGCAIGGNLLPMAYSLPESEFVGIDLAEVQIATGQAAVETLGLANVTLKQLDIMDVGDDLGQFDYIIAHGVYSWVPEPVRTRLFEICRRNLAPNGVAYVSYNTYPGWHMLNIVRDAMLYHTREMVDPQERTVKARTCTSFLADSDLGKNKAYDSFLKMYVQHLNKERDGTYHRDDALLLHDELEEVNEAVYFYQFADQAARYGLQFLAEAEFHTMVSGNLPAKVSATLREMAQGIVEMEQYLDFLQHRSFRQTLLCHEAISLNRTLTPKRVRNLYAASCAEPVNSEMDIHSTSVDQFRGTNGAVLSTYHPITKAAMLHLNEVWPQAVSFDALLDVARARLAAPGGTDYQSTLRSRGGHASDVAFDHNAHALGASLLKGFRYDKSLMELATHAPHVVHQVSERPVASLLARLQAQDGAIVTSLRHERVNLDEFNRYLLLHLDGEHDREALLASLLAGPMAGGILKMEQDDRPVEDAEKVHHLLIDVLERNLHRLARTALLEG